MLGEQDLDPFEAGLGRPGELAGEAAVPFGPDGDPEVHRPPQVG